MVLQKDLVLDTLLDVGMNKQELQSQSSTTLVAYPGLSRLGESLGSAFASGFNACSRTYT
jgi:hypothetical protein